MDKRKRLLAGQKKGLKGGIVWSPKEAKDLKRLFQVENKYMDEIAKILNDKYWNGKKVRTNGSVEKKIHREGWWKKKHSRFSRNSITPKQKKIWQLKYVHKLTNVKIAKIMGIPLGTVKSNLSYMKNHSMMKENNAIDAEIAAAGDPDEIRTNEQLIETNKSLEKQLTRAKAVTSIIVDNVIDVVKKLPPIKPPTIIVKKGMHKPEIAVLELGDLHMGEKVRKGDVADTTEYSFDKFVERTKILREGIIECVDIQRSKIPIDTLEINGLGDMVTGEDIYIGQMRSIDRDLMDQTFKGAHTLAKELIYPMAKYFKHVRFRGVWGNHGRGFGKPGQVSPRTNFDYVVYMFLKQMFSEVKNVDFLVAECPIMLYQIPEAPEFTHLMSHGNTINSWMQIPFYGLQRDAGKYVQLFNMPIHYIHMGHFHNAAKIDVPYGELILNGTFVGGSELSVIKMKTKSRPKQILFGFNRTRGKTWSYDIQLTPMTKMEKDEKGIYTAWNHDTFNLT